ncbi:MAG TPA: SGNH/GDSL hydrolase family protein [Longimicrobium sp.]|nr:SGNH/GDSL hydrolase family protein [Longimicrobium sp.]
MPHVVLLGDSIFDNKAYVRGGPDVLEQLTAILPAGWTATLLARDGAVAAEVPWQLRNLPGDATHLVLSAGGNDALGHVGILDQRATSFGEVLDALAAIGGRFEQGYRAMLEQVTATGLPVTVCTIYNGNLGEPVAQRRATVALTVFNDAILRAAAAAGHPTIDLRLVCDHPGDYANPIEPSARGGEKIARAIGRALTGVEPGR